MKTEKDSTGEVPAISKGFVVRSLTPRGNFDNEKQDNFKADFGFDAPYQTKYPCSNPVFADPHLHRIAVMKDYHIGSKGDVDETGLPGWVCKKVCTGCGKRFTNYGGFRLDAAN